MHIKGGNEPYARVSQPTGGSERKKNQRGGGGKVERSTIPEKDHQRRAPCRFNSPNGCIKKECGANGGSTKDKKRENTAHTIGEGKIVQNQFQDEKTRSWQ